MDVSDLDYHLPQDLIAQEPLADRAASRLLVVSRQSRQIQDRLFRELPELLLPKDFLVLNNSRVFPARLLGHRESGGAVEVLLLRPAESSHDEGKRAQRGSGPVGHRHRRTATPVLWEALARPKRKLRLHSRILFPPELTGTVVRIDPGEKILIELQPEGDLDAVLERIGHVPLPPYIHRSDSASDKERYQTIYADPHGSVAAPTAGLHFTPETLGQLKSRQVDLYFITLHVGYGTFRPIKTETIERHRIDPENFEISPATAAGIRQALHQEKRPIAVGTTTTRVLEHWKRRSPMLEPLTEETDLFIYPPFQFQMVEGLLTNFHLPRSSLFALVCAFLGTELAHTCYRHAVEQRYRFYSYGDCMLIV